MPGRKLTPVRALALVTVMGFGSTVDAAPPRVVRATPDNADIGVDPGLAEIRITFDQDMDHSSRSICGGGPTFPAIQGDITWSDARTIIVPVKLEPGKTYSFSVNCPAAHGFASAKGEAAEIYPISFATRKKGEPAPQLDAAIAKSALAKLRKGVDERYSYRDLRKVDWDSVFAEHGPAIERATTPSELARAAANLLRAAEDIHITVRVGEFVLGTHRRTAPLNLDVVALKMLIKDWQQPNRHIATGTYEGIPYLLITEWSGSKTEFDPAIAFIRNHTSSPAMIVDVRANSGGDEMLAREIAGCFIAKSAVYSRNKSRDPAAPGGWTAISDRVVEPRVGGPHFGGRVAVLMGKQCMSSNESFILMMREGAHAALVGERTWGASGNPRPVDIGSGVQVLLPTWVDLLSDGTPLEGRGITPSDTVAWKPQPGLDPVLDAAARILNARDASTLPR